MPPAARAGHFSRVSSRFDDLCHRVITHVRAYDRQGLDLTRTQLAHDLSLRAAKVDECLEQLASLQLVRLRSRGTVELGVGLPFATPF